MAKSIGKIASGDSRLRLVAYPGDNMVLLAMSLAKSDVSASKNLAGFAIYRKKKGGAEEELLNRLSFDARITSETTPEDRVWTPSSQAPFQKFRWVDVMPFAFDDVMTYRVVAKYFTGVDTAMKDGPSATVTVSPLQKAFSKFEVAFTRGYASSQAYAAKFHNADIRPKGPKQPDFDTKPFERQYAWLGVNARRLMFRMVNDCLNDASTALDVFAYDLDEPDLIAALCELGRQGRLRAVLDNASLHTKAGAVEPRAAAMLAKAAGARNVVKGKFSRFQHNKVLLVRDNTAARTPRKVLFGSMNFSLRGLYVQANNVIVARDAVTPALFAAAFDNAFANKVAAKPFASAAFARDYNVISDRTTASTPKASLALSPHSDDTISLGPAVHAIRSAETSVLFAVMEPNGTGGVLNSLRQIAGEPTIFSYGTVETDGGLHVQNGEGTMGALTSYAYLKDKVPANFRKEWSGGSGKHIHHKFVVLDFNGDNPVVLTGSSNLAAGGEKANGDSLIMIEDPLIAGAYAVEAVRLFDHYSFRKYMATATRAAPLTLWWPSKPNAPTPWWTNYYDPTHIHFRDRCLFAKESLPPGVATRKVVDWTAIDNAPPPKATKKPAAKPTVKPKAKPAR